MAVASVTISTKHVRKKIIEQEKKCINYELNKTIFPQQTGLHRTRA